ncbi:uncharacterized protein LOC129613003 [Condylostylus longicornis]|uniref:uncharacterized protein LOC129613003 n=1 Tax=Condylostylus longicornis TaxID=2530218 RepID=UPI00244DE842|nr:uncharacterized protein LOC129613003 [Condylostylus longicornis]
MNTLRVNMILHSLRRFSQAAKTPSSLGGATKSTPPNPTMQGINTQVEGLSSRCVKSSAEPVGPGASANGEYKVPEYFLYSKGSYAEAEIELAKYRCPQPSALKK